MTSSAMTPQTRSHIGKVAAVVGIIANILLAAAKLTIGVLGGVLSVTADGMNNLSDATASVVTLVGFKFAEKPADNKHPFGHARYEYIAGTVVAAMILFIGFELASSAISKIITPSPVTFSPLTITVLGMSIAVKLWLTLYNRRLGKRIASTTLMATASDALSDVMATTAVLIAILVEAATELQLDGYIGLAVACFILYNGVRALKDTVDPLIGMSGSKPLRDAVTAIVTESSKVVGCHDLLIHDYGPNNCFASIHVEMDCREDPMLCHTIIDDIERRCFEELHVHLVIHYDPIAADDRSLAALRDRVQTILLTYHDELLLHDFRVTEDDDITRLCFDVLLPDALRGQEETINRYLSTALAAENDSFDIAITFDPS